MWSYGNPNNPKSDDPRFDSETAAIEAAVQVSIKATDEPILAVWNDDDGECTTLVWSGWVYTA